MSLNCGIIGLPNVGKSTLFNALTNNQVAAENYPFCTIEPHHGIVKLPDSRLTQLALLSQSAKTVPAMVEFVDIAGLVKGAYSGAGKGNAFLSNIRETNLLIHVVRCFDDDNINHVDGRVDPVADAEIINFELIMSDAQMLEKYLSNIKKKARGFDGKQVEKVAQIEKLLEHVQNGNSARHYKFPEVFDHDISLLSAKPVLYVANVSEDEIQSGNKHTKALGAFVEQENAQIINLCSKLEYEISVLDHTEQQEMLQLYGLEHPGLDQLIQIAYDKLNFISFFTTGPKESRAWTIAKGTLAPLAASKIHSDIQRGFICAETISYSDFAGAENYVTAKKNGLVRQEGKTYEVQDGDVILFRFNV